MDLLETFASQSSVAIVNARLFRELETKSAELEVASRHKSEFLASMSHELRTPLNAVIGFSEVLLDRLFGELNERQDEYVHDIWNSGRHLLELLNEILDLSKVEAGQMALEPTTFRVADALEYAALARPRARGRATASPSTSTSTPDVGSVHADELRFKQVVLNLVSNAVKFTPDGGRGRRARGARRHDELVVTVTDTGIGIPPEDRERIFESFQQGGRGVAREEGTGLGLTLSRRIVELFEGRLWLESRGRARAAPSASPFPQTPTPSRRGRSTARTIGPDHPARRRRPRLAGPADGLPRRARGCGSSGPRDGEEALRLARALRPGGVVLDIRLPTRRRLEVLAELRRPTRRPPGCPVVIVSVVDERPQGLALGAAEYLIKPVSRDDLLDALAPGRRCPIAGRTQPGRERHDAATHPRRRGQPAEPQAGP